MISDAGASLCKNAIETNFYIGESSDGRTQYYLVRSSKLQSQCPKEYMPCALDIEAPPSKEKKVSTNHPQQR